MPVMIIGGNRYYDWELLAAEIRTRLADTNWTQLADTELTSGEVALFAAYRAELRAILLSTEPAYSIALPVAPDFLETPEGTYETGLEVPPIPPNPIPEP